MFRIMSKGRQSGQLASLATLIKDESDVQILVDEFNTKHGSWLEFSYQDAADPVPDGVMEIGTEFAVEKTALETVYIDPVYSDEEE